jgi:outer membrane protein assembly factor BamD (BamD/ComL family)
MTFRPILPILLLLMQSALPAQDAAALMRKGDAALAAGLWEMAALHFNGCLASPSLSPDERSRAAIRLAEAWIREGKPAEAMELLGQSFVSSHPEAPFWKGQALAASGKLTEAAGIFSEWLQDASAPHRSEAAFTLSSLELALDRPEAALAALAKLAESSDPALAARAKLHQVEILLDLGKSAEARETMPAAGLISPADASLATFLEASLLLAEKRPADAASSFQTLVDQPKGQSLRRHHAAVIGLADALRAAGNGGAATDLLLDFIQDQPDSPLLGTAFNRLQDALPESPSANDPILERVSQWITPPELPATGPLATGECSAVSAWPTPSITSDLLACSLFTRALGLHRLGTPAAHAEAELLLTRLRVENPGHFLADRAMLLAARRSLAEGDASRAFALLETLRESSSSPTVKGKAAFIQARAAYDRGERDQAVALFEEAANTLSAAEANAARLNAAIVRITDPSGAKPILQTSLPENPAIEADVQLERALAMADPAAKRGAIEEFLARHPDHPRTAEAREAAAQAALSGPTPDLSFARAQVDAIASGSDPSSTLPASRIALLRLRIDDLANDSSAAIATARSILDQYPGDPAAAEAALILGRNLFQTRSYNDARLVLEKLAAADTDPARAQAAWLLAARSAALVPTSQSRQEALILFDKAIESKGPVVPLAKMEKARLMIDMNRLAEAAAFLRKWFDSLPPTDPLHLPAGLLLGEAIYAQGSASPGSLEESLAVYDKLLVHAQAFPSVFDRLQFLRGRTLEQLPDEKNPALKREKQAFIAYYSVLETSTPPAEWHYFELCGFRALALLEKAGRWPAAIACARRIASFNGPRAEEASTRASQLQLKHMIWED